VNTLYFYFRLLTCEGIFERLFKAQEFEDGKIDRRVQTKTAFVGAQSGVELRLTSTAE
jgi:hypothetical protein